MGPVIVIPDTELWATRWIRAALNDPDIYVANVVPNPLRPRMVIVRDDGGPRTDFLHRTAVMVFNVYGPTESEASALASTVEALLLSIRAWNPVEYVTSLAAPVRVADVQPRRYFTLEIVFRGQDSSMPGTPYEYPVSDDGTDDYSEYGRDPYGNLVIDGGGPNDSSGA